MNPLLERAFMALGKAPTKRELALVAETLVESGDKAAIAVLEAAGFGPPFVGIAELQDLASASGSSAFVALDLICEFAKTSDR